MKDTLQHFIAKIENIQSKGDRYFPEGIFPAYRDNSLIGYNRADTTMFFSAIIAFTLQSIFEQTDIITNGYWGFEKIGDMLPYDYKQL